MHPLKRGCTETGKLKSQASGNSMGQFCRNSGQTVAVKLSQD